MEAGALDRWLAHLEGLHPTGIDLGLERVEAVARKFGVTAPRARVITVGGTNGKGSVCALLEELLAVSGRRVGLYTSPHLVRFNERIRIDGVEAGDAAIVEALERVEAARDGISLTYFEFGTLAAFDLFARARVDVWVLEVGLGGRLDATNVVDPDVAVVTSVAIDHAEWLGEDRDAVGREKAGIARARRPLIVGDGVPPAGLIASAETIGADIVRIGDAFDFTVTGDRWDWIGPDTEHAGLPLPALAGGYQVRNAATALAALHWAGLDCSHAVIGRALRALHVPGRFEVVPGEVETILDVAHNPAAAAMLADTLRARACPGHTLGVLAMYGDKDSDGVVGHLAGCVDGWYVAGLSGPRGSAAETLASVLGRRELPVLDRADDPAGAWRQARADARPGDRIVVLGSFATVAQVSAVCSTADSR